MKDFVKDQINVLFKLLAEAANNEKQLTSMAYYYRIIGSIDILFYQGLISEEEHLFLSNAAWEVYF